MIKPKGDRIQKQIPKKNIELVHERSKGLCEACGSKPGAQIHHRQYRSRGGGHEVANLLFLCGLGNSDGCHGLAHKDTGRRLGWAVSAWNEPELVPVLHSLYGLVLLDNEGGWEPTKKKTDFMKENQI